MFFLKLKTSSEQEKTLDFFPQQKLAKKCCLTLKDPFISESRIKIKIELNFYFHTSLWCLKRFYEGLMKARHDKEVKIKI